MSENLAYFGQRREERWTPERRWRARAELVARGEQEGMHLPQAGEGGERARRAEPAARGDCGTVTPSLDGVNPSPAARAITVAATSRPMASPAAKSSCASPGQGEAASWRSSCSSKKAARAGKNGAADSSAADAAPTAADDRGVLATVVSLLRGCRRLVLRQRQIGQHSRSSDDVQRAGPGLLPGDRIPPDGRASLPELRRREGGIGWSGHLARTSDREAQQRAGQESVRHEIPPCDLTGG